MEAMGGGGVDLGASAEKPTRRRKSDFFLEEIASWSKKDSGF
jgi:hypothetical protein